MLKREPRPKVLPRVQGGRAAGAAIHLDNLFILHVPWRLQQSNRKKKRTHTRQNFCTHFDHSKVGSPARVGGTGQSAALL